MVIHYLLPTKQILLSKLKIISCLVVFLFINKGVQSQSPYQDSLTQEGMIFHDKMAVTSPTDSIIHWAKTASIIFEKAENWIYVSSCLNWLTFAYYTQEDWTNGIRMAQQAKELAIQQFGDNSVEYVNALSNLAIFLDKQGDYLSAIETTKTAIATEEHITTGDPAMILASYLNLAFYYQNMGDFEEANSYLKEVKRLRVKGEIKNDPSEASFYYLMAACAKGNGQMEDAFHFAHQCIHTISAKQPIPDYLKQNQLDACHILANYHLELEQLDSADLYANTALDIQNSGQFFNDYKTFHLLGKSQIAKGHLKEAFTHFEKAIEATKIEFKDYQNHPTIAACHSQLADAFALDHQYTKSLEYYQKALKFNTLGFQADSDSSNPSPEQFINNAIALEIMKGKTDLLFQWSQTSPQHLQSAYDSYLLFDQLIQQTRQEYLTDATKFSLTEQAVPVYERAILTALRLYETTNEKQYQKQALVFAENNKAASMLAKMQEWKAKGAGGIPDSLLNKERQLKIAINYYLEGLATEQAFKNIDSNKVEMMEQQAFRLKQESQTLDSYLEKNYPDYFKLKHQANELTLLKIRQELLDQEKAIIEFFIGEENLFVFHLTHKKLEIYPCPIPNDLDSMVSVFRSTLLKEPDPLSIDNNFSDFSGTAFAFYQLLLEKALADPSGPKRLCIIPDDVLHMLPFGLFLQKKPNNNTPDFSLKNMSYVMEDYPIHYAFFIRTLLDQVNKETIATTNFLGIAPTFGQMDNLQVSRTCEANELLPLSCNKEEVNKIANLFENPQQLLDENGTTTAFKQHSPHFKIVHLATHACLHPTDPMLNKVFFTDDFLTNFDLGNLRLKADLAVLSACNTGTGKLYKGEGVMSLARSFANAGCSSLLTSLWSVDDCSTADLMVLFYENIRAGFDKDIALQKAELQYITDMPPSKQHPYYWGGFVHVGQAKALFNRKKTYWYYWLGGMILVLGGMIFLKKTKRLNG